MKQAFLISQISNNTFPQIVFISRSVHHIVCYNLSNLYITQPLWRSMWRIYECQEKFRRYIFQIPQYHLYSGNSPFSLDLCKILHSKWKQWWRNFHFCCQNLCCLCLRDCNFINATKSYWNIIFIYLGILSEVDFLAGENPQTGNKTGSRINWIDFHINLLWHQQEPGKSF